MPTTTEIAGRFLYASDVIPKGNRNPRRALIHAPALFEIPTADTRDVETDALMIKARAHEQVSYALHEDRLYRPAKAARGQAMSLDLYRRMLARWPSLRHGRAPEPTYLALHTDPIVHSYGPHDVHHWPVISDPEERCKDFPVYEEEDFKGRIVSSDRDTALRRYQRAARHVLLVNDEVLYRAIEPMWVVESTGIHPMALTPGFEHGDYYAPEALGLANLGNVFALHRLDDAKAWFTERHGNQDCQVDGEILRHCPSYRPEPALTRPLQGSLSDVLRAIDSNRKYLGAESYAAWGRLRAAGASVESYDLGELVRSPIPLVADIVSVMNDLEERFLPKAAERFRSDIKDESSMLRERARFERDRSPTLTEEDDLSIAAASL
jgi:hypothetical protein